MSRDEIIATVVAEMLSWEGTPYRQNCMQRGRGADCARLGIRGYKVAGLIPWHVCVPVVARDRLLAGDTVDKNLFRDFILRFAVEIPYDERAAADLITFEVYGVESHVGVLIDRDWMIDARSRGRVRRRRVTKLNTFCAVYRHKALMETEAWATT